MSSIIGTISGTSADGIDIAEIETDGHTVAGFGPSTTGAYRTATRGAVLEAIANGPSDRCRWQDIAQQVTDDHAEAILHFVNKYGLSPKLVVFHGQTVWHDPANRESVQLGVPQSLADRLGIPVVGDIRQADIAAGGEGAPLVPVYHRALAQGLEQPVCFLNIGGVSNLTFIDGDRMVACDIGPGNALLDDWIRRHRAGEYDKDGQFSGAGKIDLERVEQAISHPYFGRPWPKSLDRNAFSLQCVEGMSLEDGAATLAAFSARTIAKAAELCPSAPKLWIVCGGGRHNPTLMRLLVEQLPGRVEKTEAYGFDGDSLEAQAMAFLGARFEAGLPTSYPETTGVRQPVIGGRLYTPSTG